MKTRLNKYKNRAFGALLALFLSCSAGAQQDVNGAQSLTQQDGYQTETAESWLAKMSHAMKSLNYSASFVLLKPGVDAQPYLWQHAVNNEGVELERLNLLNGPGKEVVRIGNKVSYFESNFPPYSLLSSTINGPIPSSFFLNPVQLTDSYDFVMVGRGRISGRAAQQIRILSKDRTRYGLNVWLDQQTGLLLKLNLFNLKGQLLEQVQVTELQVTEKPNAFFSKIEKGMLPEVVVYPTNQFDDSKWDVRYLPVGMSIVKRDFRRLSGTSTMVEYIMLSDGLVDVSLYLRDVSDAQPADNIVGKVQSDTLLTVRNGDLDVTVIGKIPAETANAIATSVESIK